MRLFYVEAVANEELGMLLRKHCGSELHDVVTAWVEDEVAKGRISFSLRATRQSIFWMSSLRLGCSARRHPT